MHYSPVCDQLCVKWNVVQTLFNQHSSCNGLVTLNPNCLEPQAITMPRLLVYSSHELCFGLGTQNSRPYNVNPIKCSLDAANAGITVQPIVFFGDGGHITSDEVVIHLIKTTCVPTLLYGLEALPSVG